MPQLWTPTCELLPTALAREVMQSSSSVRLSRRPFFPLCLRNRLIVDLELLHVRGHDRARRGFKVKIMDQANAVGPTSIDSSFFLVMRF